MKRLLSIINLLGVLFFCRDAAAAAGPDIIAARQPGASLDTSVRNEADNAMRLAAEWLTARQHPDGSWGSPDASAVLTPIVWFALEGMGNAVDAMARHRAAVWLDNHPPGDNAPFDAYLWRLLAMLHGPPDSPFKTVGVELKTVEALAPNASAYSRWLWRETDFLLTSSGPYLTDSAKRQLALIAADYPLDTQNTETFWFFARLINRYSKGVWIRGTEVLDWRNDFGLALINMQRKDPARGGYWNGATDDAKIRATAFALLALHEID